VIVMAGKFKLIKNTLSQEARMQHRIDAFRRDLYNEDGSMENLELIMNVVYEYLSQFEHDDLCMSGIRIKESIFYISNFNNL